MFLEFATENFMSFRNEAVLSLVPASYHEGEELSPHRIAGVFGPNGSGKSNLLKALEYISWFMNGCKEFGSYSPCPPKAHLLSQSEPTRFRFQFTGTQGRIGYELTMLKMHVMEEFLWNVNGKEKREVFFRKQARLETANVAHAERLDDAMHGLPDSKPLLAYIAKRMNDPVINEAVDFFRNCIVFDSDPCEQSFFQSKRNLELFVRMLGCLNAGITGFDIGNEYFFRYGENRIKLHDDSDGLRSCYYTLHHLCHVMNHGGLYVCDNFGDSLHESVSEAILQKFLELGGINSQFIFSAHNSSILNSDALKRDQIWFTSNDRDKMESKLYSLVELQGIHKDENYRNGFLKGKYDIAKESLK